MIRINAQTVKKNRSYEKPGFKTYTWKIANIYCPNTEHDYRAFLEGRLSGELLPLRR